MAERILSIINIRLNMIAKTIIICSNRIKAFLNTKEVLERFLPPLYLLVYESVESYTNKRLCLQPPSALCFAFLTPHLNLLLAHFPCSSSGMSATTIEVTPSPGCIVAIGEL
uniref:Uncharacterized protein n=1 Tax=Cacopsylla melanoneura TaxID=428564 RepID=A0A8D8U782_9HEMI